jgi:hypothetical protein
LFFVSTYRQDVYCVIDLWHIQNVWQVPFFGSSGGNLMILGRVMDVVVWEGVIGGP